MWDGEVLRKQLFLITLNTKHSPPSSCSMCASQSVEMVLTLLVNMLNVKKLNTALNILNCPDNCEFIVCRTCEMHSYSIFDHGSIYS